ncbi:MAG: hypothetical protein SAL70_23600, partial [Scytonema sp. PMC 1070.18]|nr:hypothetical protein [Scytonema sp. PMC 1070.18]
RKPSCATRFAYVLARRERETARIYPQGLPDRVRVVKPPQPAPSPEPAPPPQPAPAPNDPPPLEGQPGDFPKPSTTQIEERLKAPEDDYKQRRQNLLQRLQANQQATTPPGTDPEFGKLILQEQPLEQVPQPPPVVVSKPLGFLLANVGYFQTSNIFSSAIDPQQDGLVYSGLTLVSAPIPIGSKTYLNGSINGNIIRYIDQSQYNYNQLRFNVSIYQQISSRMYGELGWSNQQFFYTKNGNSYSAGDRFLNENSVQLSFGRRDPLTPKLMLDSFYELRLSLTDLPNNIENRDRVTNSVWLSLNYYLKKSLQIGLDYQFTLTDFTRRERQDQYHRIYSHLNYQVSTNTNLSLQGGFNLGISTEDNIDYNGWFFSINYNLELGRF